MKFSACHDGPWATIAVLLVRKNLIVTENKKIVNLAFVYCDSIFVASRKISPSIVTLKIRRREDFVTEISTCKKRKPDFPMPRTIFVTLKYCHFMAPDKI